LISLYASHNYLIEGRGKLEWLFGLLKGSITVPTETSRDVGVPIANREVLWVSKVATTPLEGAISHLFAVWVVQGYIGAILEEV
jgi:hypothetical protein